MKYLKTLSLNFLLFSICISLAQKEAEIGPDQEYGPLAMSDEGNSRSERLLNSIDITVLSNKYDQKVIYLPTAFSPNSDGINDQLYVRGNGIDKFELNIYNRFGELVFKTTNLDEGWNGYYNGEMLNSEVYMAHVNVTFFDGEQKQLFGNITLVL